MSNGVYTAGPTMSTIATLLQSDAERDKQKGLKFKGSVETLKTEKRVNKNLKDFLEKMMDMLQEASKGRDKSPVEEFMDFGLNVVPGAKATKTSIDTYQGVKDMNSRMKQVIAMAQGGLKSYEGTKWEEGTSKASTDLSAVEDSLADPLTSGITAGLKSYGTSKILGGIMDSITSAFLPTELAIGPDAPVALGAEGIPIDMMGTDSIAQNMFEEAAFAETGGVLPLDELSSDAVLGGGNFLDNLIGNLNEQGINIGKDQSFAKNMKALKPLLEMLQGLKGDESELEYDLMEYLLPKSKMTSLI